MQNPSGQRRKIAIIGAGLTGSLLGILLGRRGYSVDIYEKRPDMRKARIAAGRSINLAISTRGITALAHAGVKDAVMAKAIAMHGRMIHGRDGALFFQPYSAKPDEFINALSRAELNIELMNAAESYPTVKLHFNHRADHYDLRQNRLDFFDESTQQRKTIDTDLVIGADGVASAIRDALIQATHGSATMEGLSHGYKELYIPPGKDGSYLIEKNALHIWPRGSHMMIALANQGGSFTVTLFMEELRIRTLDDEAKIHAFFDEEFPDARALLHELPQNFLSHPTGFLGTVHAEPWHFEDKALVLGDSAHAIVPFYGQGMNACFEDCVVLDGLIDSHQHDWAAILPHFFKLRKPNADAIADLALANYIEMRDLTGKEEFLKQKAFERKLVEMFPDAYLPSYSIVTFSHLPYLFAKQAKALQEELLRGLCSRYARPEDLKHDEITEDIARYARQASDLLDGTDASRSMPLQGSAVPFHIVEHAHTAKDR